MIINNITFNFLDKYYPFYEWLAEDELITKKCYVYKVSSNVLTSLLYLEVFFIILSAWNIKFCLVNV